MEDRMKLVPKENRRRYKLREGECATESCKLPRSRASVVLAMIWPDLDDVFMAAGFLEPPG